MIFLCHTRCFTNGCSFESLPPVHPISLPGDDSLAISFSYQEDVCLMGRNIQNLRINSLLDMNYCPAITVIRDRQPNRIGYGSEHPASICSHGDHFPRMKACNGGLQGRPVIPREPLCRAHQPPVVARFLEQQCLINDRE